MIADVVIAGAGPNGLMLACELRLAGVRPVVLERLPEPRGENRANGLVGQVVRMLDRRGLYQPPAGKSEPPQPIPGLSSNGPARVLAAEPAQGGDGLIEPGARDNVAGAVGP